MEKRHDIMCGMVEWHCDDECRRMDCQTQQLFESWVMASDGFCFFNLLLSLSLVIVYAMPCYSAARSTWSSLATLAFADELAHRSERSKGRRVVRQEMNKNKELPNCITKRQNFWPWVTVGNLSGKNDNDVACAVSRRHAPIPCHVKSHL